MRQDGNSAHRLMVVLIGLAGVYILFNIIVFTRLLVYSNHFSDPVTTKRPQSRPKAAPGPKLTGRRIPSIIPDFNGRPPLFRPKSISREVIRPRKKPNQAPAPIKAAPAGTIIGDNPSRPGFAPLQAKVELKIGVRFRAMSVKTLALQEKNRPKAAAPQKSTAPALVLHFDVNQDGLSPSEKKKLLDFLSNHHFTNKNKLLVVGHSCLNGPVRYNRQLSQKRAESAARIIKESTNDALSLTVEGQGESNPIYAGENLEQGRVNRRVEIHVLQ